MGIGLGVLLLVLGAILYFTGLDSQLLDMNLNTVGIILMAGGALALILGLIQNAQNAKRTTVTEMRGGPTMHEREVRADGSYRESHVEPDDRV